MTLFEKLFKPIGILFVDDVRHVINVTLLVELIQVRRHPLDQLPLHGGMHRNAVDLEANLARIEILDPCDVLCGALDMLSFGDNCRTLSS